VTGNVSNAIASLAKAWPGKNLTIVQSGVGTQLTDGFVNMAYAVQVAIGLVYLLLVIFFALPLVVITGFVSLATTGRALDLSTLIGLLMLRGIVVTNAVVLLTLVQHKIETGDDVCTVLIQGGRIWKCPMLMTAAATILTLIRPAHGYCGHVAATARRTARAPLWPHGGPSGRPRAGVAPCSPPGPANRRHAC
jgi:HAE1 family hydrophobic/amphiphilic exporter-1